MEQRVNLILAASDVKHTLFVQIISSHGFHGTYFLHVIAGHSFYVIENLSSLADLDLRIFILHIIKCLDKLTLLVQDT